jgi:small-conductance mechanosensitive channel
MNPAYPTDTAQRDAACPSNLNPTESQMETIAVNTDSIIDPAITVAAEHVARADADLAEHRRVTQQARQAEQQLRDRIAALDARRAAISQRRQAGDTRPGDGADLEVIRLDKEGLEEMRAEAAAMVADAQEKERAAAGAVELTRNALQRSEDQAELDALMKHANTLGALMLETVGQMAEVGRRIGSHNYLWSPPADLMDRLNRAKIAGRPL